MPEDVSGSDQFSEDDATTTLPYEALEELPEEVESLEESIYISGNDLSEYQDDGSMTDLQMDPTQVEALVEVCTEINQNIVTGTVAILIMLGFLIGIVLVRGLGGFLKGV